MEAAGAEVIVLPNPAGKVDLSTLLAVLGERGINELHVEAGSKLNGSLMRERCVDELLVYLAPCLLGDAQRMIAMPAVDGLERRIPFHFDEATMIGADLRLRARLGNAREAAPNGPHAAVVDAS